MTVDLVALISAASDRGWATDTGTIEDVRLAATRRGLKELHAGGKTLRPMNPTEAPPNSLSAKYGTDEQPLHTDGVQLLNPPDFVVLVSKSVSPTPTYLWSAKTATFAERAAVEDGVFLVVNGKDSFFCTSWSTSRIRYDPGCMVPCDSRAKDAAAYFKDRGDDHFEHAWDSPDKILFLDNRWTLHARASAAHDMSRELQRIEFHDRGR
jgi:hypothetical protein